tara:strand:- start:798 stop:1004 length:207 start_codon:yes stop_codon:yes gene_type:complete
MTNWVTEHEKSEMVKRFRKNISDSEIISLIESSVEIIEEGRFPHNLLPSVVTVQKIIGKIKNGSINKS